MEHSPYGELVTTERLLYNRVSSFDIEYCNAFAIRMNLQKEHSAYGEVSLYGWLLTSHLTGLNLAKQVKLLFIQIKQSSWI